ncbi:MAG: DUF4097 domain-containing protein [Clostridiales bacterium]|nr:DUF4097 domain-containing protein [Clostridiales bacterium]
MKTVKIVSIVIWALVAVLLTAVLVAGIAGDCKFIGFSFGGYQYDHAEDYTVGGGTCQAEIKEIDIHWTAGSIQIEPYDGDEIVIRETGAKNEDTELRWLNRNGTLTIQYSKPRKFFGLFHNLKKELTLLLPKETADNLEKLTIDTVSARVDMRDLTCHEIDIETVSGDLQCLNMQTALADVEAVSADIEMTGNIGGLDIDIVSGECVIDNEIMPYEIDFDGVSGDFTMSMPDGNGFNLKHDKVSGDFYCDFPTIHESGRYSYGDGSANYNFDIVSGDVTLNRKQVVKDEF